MTTPKAIAIVDKCFNIYHRDVSDLALPSKFTFPFYYEPHELSIIASQELQQRIAETLEPIHNFGLEVDAVGHAIGKMFGVLVVQTGDGRLGYLAAFSGKLADSNHHVGFVPPVFDMLTDGSFYKAGESELNAMTAQLQSIEHRREYLLLDALLKKAIADRKQLVAAAKKRLNYTKKDRKLRRAQANADLTGSALEAALQSLVQESLRGQYMYKVLVKYWDQRVHHLEQLVAPYHTTIADIKQRRKELSAQLQNQLFNQYKFYNANLEQKSLHQIFYQDHDKRPPAGAGECAAPKLLHYAYRHGMRPVAMAEFWYGAPLPGEVRRHLQYYPSCRSKCEPILEHMLQGLSVDDNVLLTNPAEQKQLQVVYEDDDMVVINKPEEMLSVRGRRIRDSVQTRMEAAYPNTGSPLIVHRLDMSTSGILVVAKTKHAHQRLQSQFSKRKVEKRYVAVLEGELQHASGEINLPLRVDLDNRPRQMICYEHGKPARTRYEVIEVKDGLTRVYFYPITGRTHQLRVHAAHHKGLGLPIVGDDLYGTKGERLCLHAERLLVEHPSTKEMMTFQVPAEF